MNFDQVNKVSDYCRDNIVPLLESRFHVPDFGYYLSRMAECPSCKWMRTGLHAYPLTYFVEPVAFMRKYQEKCITFLGSGNPNDGAMTIIYQISPTLHVLARLYHTIEHEKVQAYLMLTTVYENMEDYNLFFDENKELRLTGNTEEKIGFKRGLDTSVGFGDLMRQLKSQNPPSKDSEEEEDQENP